MIKTLKGIKAVDLTSLDHVGSAYSKLLAEYGAEVILVEPAGADRTRQSHEADFYHGGKKSLAVDLHTREGQEILWALLKEADVFVTDYFERDLKALGVDYAAVSAGNPRIIYAHGSVYGEEGPLKDTAGDAGAVWWATSGAMWCTMELGDLAPIPNPGLPEVNVGKSLVLGICAALYRRIKTGKGMYLSSSVLGDAIYSNADSPLEMQYGAEYPKTRKRPRRATLNTYRCKDGWIALITLSFEKDFGNLMEAIGRPDLRGDTRWQKIEDTMYDKSPEVVEIMDQALARLTCEEAVSRIKAYDMAVIKIATVDDVLKDPQVLANRFLVEVKDRDGKSLYMPQSPVRFGDYEPGEYLPAPVPGADTREILVSHGYSEARIEALAAEGIIVTA